MFLHHYFNYTKRFEITIRIFDTFFLCVSVFTTVKVQKCKSPQCFFQKPCYLVVAIAAINRHVYYLRRHLSKEQSPMSLLGRGVVSIKIFWGFHPVSTRFSLPTAAAVTDHVWTGLYIKRMRYLGMSCGRRTCWLPLPSNKRLYFYLWIREVR